MTATTTEPIVRTARSNGVCGAPDCLALIYAGALITKPADGAWRHLDCTRPGKRGKANRNAVHAMRTGPQPRHRG